MSDRRSRSSPRRWLRVSVRALIIFVLVAGGWLGLLVRNARIRREAIYAKENWLISEGFSAHASTSQPGPLNMVGNLAASTHWSNLLPLTAEQKLVITRLDKLVRKGHYLSLMFDAEPFDGPPALRRRRLAHNDKRRSEAIHHAQRLVAMGLLTEALAAFATERYLESVGIGALNSDAVGVKEELALTESQRGELADVNARFLRQPYLPARRVGEADSNPANTWSRRYEEALREILTPSQQDRWSELTSKRSLPAGPPNATRSALSKADAASVRIEDLSPIFRTLAENLSAFGLSAEQKALVEDLKEVTRVGFVWIGRRDAETRSQPLDALKNQAECFPQERTAFLHHAEQVALLGILTKHQADQLQSAVKKN